MEIAYTVTQDDYLAAQMHWLRKNGQIRKGYFIGSVFWCGFFLLAAALFAYFVPDEIKPAALIFVAAGATCTILHLITYPRTLERRLREQLAQHDTRAMFGPVRLILTESSLTEMTEVLKVEIKWEYMIGAEEVGDRTFIYYSPSNFGILPRSAFNDDAAYEGLRDRILNRLGSRGAFAVK
jgi:hypothetical protein